MTAQSPATMSCCAGPTRARKFPSFTSPTWATPRPPTRTPGPSWIPGTGTTPKAKNAHGPNDVSNFARFDTWLLSGNTANITMRHGHGPHRSTQQHPEKLSASPWQMHDAQALLTLHGAPDCCRRYAEGPGDTPLATISMTTAYCSPDNRRGAPSFLPSASAFSKPALVRRRMDTSF